MTLAVTNLVSHGIATAFSLGAELVERCLFCKVLGPLQGLTAVSSVFAYSDLLVSTYRSADIVGSSVEVGDERAVGKVTDLAGVPDPEPGDYFVNASGVRRDIIAARRDPTGTFWLYQLRRATVDDYASLELAFYFEDWGNLGAALHTEDFDA